MNTKRNGITIISNTEAPVYLTAREAVIISDTLHQFIKNMKVVEADNKRVLAATPLIAFPMNYSADIESILKKLSNVFE